MFTRLLGYLFGIGVLGFLLAAGGVAYGIHYYSQDLPELHGVERLLATGHDPCACIRWHPDR